MSLPWPLVCALTVALSLGSGCEAPSSPPGSDATDTTTSTETDQLPPIPTLLSPGDGASDLPLEIELCWNLVVESSSQPGTGAGASA